jgi:hypothetical protein
MLLALRDDAGTIAAGAAFPYVLGGAILAELLLLKRLEVRETGKRWRKPLVEVVDPAPVGDPIVDECLQKFRDAKRRANVKTWVERLARVKRLRHRVAEELCRRHILRADEEKILLVFTRKIYPEIDRAPERALVERLRRAIFADTREVDPRTAVLVSLAHNADVLKNVFDKKRLKSRKVRIEKIANGELIGKAATEIMQAVQAAILVTCILPAVTTTATTSG